MKTLLMALAVFLLSISCSEVGINKEEIQSNINEDNIQGEIPVITVAGPESETETQDPTLNPVDPGLVPTEIDPTLTEIDPTLIGPVNPTSPVDPTLIPTEVDPTLTTADPTATRTPGNCLVGDGNGDGALDLTDINAVSTGMLQAIQSSPYRCELDLNQDNTVDLLDINHIATFFINKTNDGSDLVINQCIKGDINNDGVVDLLDVQLYTTALTDMEDECAADFNMDGVVNLLDAGLINEFINAITSSSN